MLAPFAPMSFGPSGTTAEEQGNMLKVAPDSTRKDSLLCLSFKNNNPEPCKKDIDVAILISMQRLLYREVCRFPASNRGKGIC